MLRLSVIADLREEAVCGYRVARRVLAGAVAEPAFLPLVAGTEGFTRPALAERHLNDGFRCVRDLGCYFIKDLVVAGAGQLWLEGRLVTAGEVMPIYVAEWLGVAGGGNDFVHAVGGLGVRVVEGPCLVAVGHGVGVYGHFLLEMMFRILAGRWAVGAGGCRVLLERGSPAWLLRILTLYLGVRREDIEFFDPLVERVLLRDAIVPELLLRDAHFHPFANDLLEGLMRSLILPVVAAPIERVFVVRGDFRNEATRYRVCVNEDQLAEIACRRFGFTAVRVEDLAWPEQVALFRDADIIVGLGGSALHNGLFAGAGCRLASVGLMNLVQGGIGGLRGHRNAFLTNGFELDGLFRVDEAIFENFLAALCA